MDNMEADLNESSIEAENEILKRSLVKVSFAAAGVHQELDSELQKLRQVIRAEAKADEIHKQVESIAQALMLVDDEMQQKKLQLSPSELLNSLGQQLAIDQPNLSTKIFRIISKNEQQPFISTFTKLSQLSPPLTKKSSPGFFSRLFSKAPLYPDSFLDRITQTMLNMVKQLSFLNNTKNSLVKINKEIENLSDLDEVPHLLQSICSQVFDITSLEQLRFEQFLKNLNTQLDAVQKIITSNTQSQKASVSAGNLLDQQVRNHMTDLQSKSKSAKNIVDLQHVVEDRVDEMLNNLDSYKNSLDSFVEKNAQQMNLLSTELDNSRSNINQLHQQLQEQQHLAETDPLTGLPNRHSYQRRIAEEYSRWRRYRQPLSIAIADVDHFKSINDNFGHSQGDDVLKTIAKIFVRELRETDFVARYGGEEFVFIMPETNLSQATKAINKLRQQIFKNKFLVDDQTLSLTVSMGVAEFEDNDTAEDIIERSDKALYRAKDKGRNQVCCELKSM